jgi:Cys-tRNA(Pro) deacylase
VAVTPAIRALRAAGVDFTPRPYAYVPHGGTRHSARELQVDEHAVIKTLVMQTDAGDPLVVLMHGDREVSTKALARTLGVKSVTPCDPKTAQRHTGYQVGGTSPFGTRKAIPVYMERTIADLPEICINGGKRGLLVQLSPQAVVAVLAPTMVEVATDR